MQSVMADTTGSLLSNKRQRHLWRAAEYYKHTAPEQSSYLRSRFQVDAESEGPVSFPAGFVAHVCPHCGTIWNGHNSKVLVKRCRKLPGKTRRLRKKAKRGGQLSEKETKLLMLSEKMCIVIKCISCNKNSKHVCNSTRNSFSCSQTIKKNNPFSVFLDPELGSSVSNTGKLVKETDQKEKASDKRKRKRKRKPQPSADSASVVREKLKSSLQMSKKSTLSDFLDSL